jgi:hypothetical protein
MTAAVGHDGTGVPYELVALGGHPGAPWRRVGRYADLEATLTARVEDVLAQLQANDGWMVVAEHLVIGPGPAGPASLSSFVTEIGADPHSNLVPDPFDLDGSRRWLLAANELT